MAKARGLVRRAGRRPNRPEDGFSGRSPLAPAAPGRPAARPSPCGNSAFIPNTFRIIQSNLYSFRQISRPLPFGGPASLAKARIHRAKSMQGTSLGNGSSPTPPRALCQAKEPGRSPLRAARAAPRPFFGFYTARTLSQNYTDIRQNPPSVLRSQMPCAISPVSKLRRTIQ